MARVFKIAGSADAIAAGNDLGLVCKIANAEGALGDQVVGDAATKVTGAFACFPAGTLVRMADGRAKAIEMVQLGDQVMARSDAGLDQVTRAYPVTRTFIHPADKFVALTMRDQSGVRLQVSPTSEHPFWRLNASSGWTPASSLGIGDRVAGVDGQAWVVELAERQSRPGTTVFNLEVEGAHTYFVGGIVNPTGPPAGWVWVHNTCKISNLIRESVEETVGMTKPALDEAQMLDKAAEAMQRIAKGEADVIAKMAWRSDPASYFSYKELRAKIIEYGLSGRGRGLEAMPFT